MNAIDVAKDIMKIAVTSGLSKEIIDLLEKKIALLTEQIKMLESENTNLKNKVKNLEEQLSNLNPQHDRLDQDSYNFLKIIFDYGELSIESIATSLNISEGMVRYHRDLLLEANFILQSRSEPEMYELTSLGSKYVIDHKTS